MHSYESQRLETIREENIFRLYVGFNISNLSIVLSKKEFMQHEFPMHELKNNLTKLHLFKFVIHN